MVLKKNSTNTKERDILLSAAARYIKCKVKSVYRKFLKKQPKKLIMKYIMKKI